MYLQKLDITIVTSRKNMYKKTKQSLLLEEGKKKCISFVNLIWQGYQSIPNMGNKGYTKVYIQKNFQVIPVTDL